MADIAGARRRARDTWAQRRPRWRARASGVLAPVAATRFVARIDRAYPDAYLALSRVYGRLTETAALLDDLLDQALATVLARPHDLQQRDAAREVDPEWFLDESMVGYVCYADRFGGDLRGVRQRLGYLRELGVTYLHLLPLLAPRPGPNDGGYAVADFRAVDPRLGDMDDLRALATAAHAQDINLCVDLVVNHTAREHEWARRAMAGDERYRRYYLVFGDRTQPDAYERTLPEVFPDRAPGNFTWVDELDGWVWTTFHDYQWDLDWSNPAVFGEMLGIMLELANTGVDVFRLDAVPFMWKRLGTDCQNQPEVHLLLQALRALVYVAAPAVLFKAEAIVPPDQLVQYVGAHDLERRECDLAYHNQLMVMLWSALATRDAMLPTHALARMRPPPPHATWMTYARCHDDIGWAVTDEDAAAVGLDGTAHRRFLVDFYSGAFPGSFARGARFGFNPRTLDARISGTAASLAGVEEALEREDDDLLSAAVSRLLVLHAVLYGWGGIPLLYMGDEIGLRNDHRYLDDPAKAADNRWMHRPRMDWQAAERRHSAWTLEARLFRGLQRLGEARAASAQLHGAGVTTPRRTDNRHVLAWLRRHQRFGTLLGVANVHDGTQTVDADLCRHAGLGAPRDVLQMWPAALRDGRIHLPPLSAVWLTDG